MPNFWNSIPVERYVSWGLTGIHVLVIIAFGYIFTLILKRFLRALRDYAVTLMVRRGDVFDVEIQKRATTIVNVIRKPLMLLIWAGVVITAMRETGVHIEPLLAGAGIGFGAIGVAVGLGAQTLIKDIIGGLLLLMENQIRVNDVAVINGTGGLVEEINLRTTVLRSEDGAVHVFPNGSIQTLSNLTREFSYYVWSLSLPYSEDPERVLGAMREIVGELRADPAYSAVILDNLDVMGVDKLTDSAVTIKARIKTAPIKQWMVGREVNRRLRVRIESDRIQTPLTTTVVRFEDGLPGQISPEDLKRAVREALLETGTGRAG